MAKNFPNLAKDIILQIKLLKKKTKKASVKQQRTKILHL